MRSTPADFKNPIEFLITTPVGLDRVIQTLQQSYSTNLSWLEASFGRAVKKRRKTDNESDSGLLTRQDYIYPGLWQGNNIDQIDGLANDNLNAYSFFLADEPETPIDYQDGARNIFECEIHNIFWMNLKRVDSTKNYLFAEELKLEISRVIEETTFQGGESVQIVNIIKKPEEIFQEFSIDLAETQHLEYPYHGFRFVINAIFEGNC